MVDGGWWWMVDGGRSQKRFFNFAETLHTESTPKVIFFIFGIWRENFLMGLKIEIEFENLGFFVQNQGSLISLKLCTLKVPTKLFY